MANLESALVVDDLLSMPELRIDTVLTRDPFSGEDVGPPVVRPHSPREALAHFSEAPEGASAEHVAEPCLSCKLLFKNKA